MKFFPALLTLIFLSTHAVAEWTMIQTNDDGNISIEFDTIKKSGNLITASILNDYYGMQQKSELSSQWVELHDCKNKKFKILAIDYFAQNMGKGNIIESHSFSEAETAWSDVVLYSVGELKANLICSR